MSENDDRCAWFTRVICNCSFNGFHCTRLRLPTIYLPRCSVRTTLQTTKLIKANAVQSCTLKSQSPLVSIIPYRSFLISFDALYQTRRMLSGLCNSLASTIKLEIFIIILGVLFCSFIMHIASHRMFVNYLWCYPVEKLPLYFAISYRNIIQEAFFDFMTASSRIQV